MLVMVLAIGIPNISVRFLAISASNMVLTIIAWIWITKRHTLPSNPEIRAQLAISSITSSTLLLLFSIFTRLAFPILANVLIGMAVIGCIFVFIAFYLFASEQDGLSLDSRSMKTESASRKENAFSQHARWIAPLGSVIGLLLYRAGMFGNELPAAFLFVITCISLRQSAKYLRLFLKRSSTRNSAS
jgi:hypothetical protein